MATIGSLVVSLSANSAKLVKELSKTQKTLKKWAKKAGNTIKSIGKAFGVLSTVAIGAFIIAVNKSAAAIDDMTKAAGKLKFPIEDYQRFAFIASKSNIPMENFGKSMQRMLKTVGDARDGLSTATKAFDQLGLSADDLARLNPSQQFELIAASMENVETHADKVKIAMDIFGRSGADLLNVFAGDVKGIGKEFDDLGVTITQQQADMVAKYQDSKTTLNALFKGFGKNVTAEVSPAFTLIIEKITQAVKDMGGMKEAARSFASAVINGIGRAARGFNSFISSLLTIQDTMLSLQETWIRTKAILELKPFADKSFDEQLEGSRKELEEITAKRWQISLAIANRKETDSYFENLANELDLTIGGEGGGVAETANKVVEANNQLAKSAAETAKTLEEVSKAKAWKDIFGKEDVTARSNQFDQYAKLVKNDIDSGSGFAGSNLDTLKSILETAKNNGGVGFSNNSLFEKLDIQGMTDVIKGLEALIPSGQSGESSAEINGQIQGLVKQGQVSQNVIDKLIQTQQGQKELGKLELNMITDTGKIAGEIWGEPEFITRLQAEVNKQTNNAARTAAAGN